MAPLLKLNIDCMILKNKFLTVFSAVLLMALIAGCTGKNKVEEEPQEKMSLSATDTTKVVALMNQYFDLLLNKDFDGAMSMISQLRNDSLTEMTPELQSHYLMGMKLLSPVRYELERLIFDTESDCLVKYSAVLFEKEDPTDNRPNKMFYVIKPVRVNGEWYLTVADDSDMNTRDSRIDK